MKILKSFSYAFEGLYYCISTQRNFRFHIVSAITVLLMSRFYSLSRLEILSLAATIMFVLICEMINTAVEATVDMHGGEYNVYAKVAKDVAAGAVLISAIFAVAVAFALFFDTERIIAIFNYFVQRSLLIVVGCAYAVLSVIFIAGVPFNRKKDTIKEQENKQ